jgi:hypothetical protein
MGRVNIAREFGILTDGNGSVEISGADLIKLTDNDYDEISKIVTAPAVPSCYAGFWTGNAYTQLLTSYYNRTMIIADSPSNKLFSNNGLIRQVGITAKNTGTESGKFKIKAFRRDGVGGLDFIGESEILYIPIESDLRTHVYILSTPFNVLTGDVFAYYFYSNNAVITVGASFSGTSAGPGWYSSGDISWSVRESDFSTHGGSAPAFYITQLMATTYQMNEAIINIDLDGHYRTQRIEVFTDKYTNKELVKIETSNDQSDWLEYIDHKYYTRWATVEDGNDLITFNSTKGIVYAQAEGTPRFWRVTLLSSCFGSRSIYEVVILNDPQYIEFRPPDQDLIAGNWIGKRGSILSLNGRTRIDLTEPVSKDGYIYGIRIYGRSEIARAWTFYVFRDKGSYLELISTSASQAITASGIDGINDFYLITPMKARAGDYIGVKGETNSYIEYDANATATTPWGDPGNTGTGVISGSVIVSNDTTETEEWTLECISTPAPNGEEWKVTGSVSGEQSSSAWTGVQYTSDNTEVQFTIVGDAPNYFIVGDKIYFDTIKQGDHWHILDSEVTGTIGQQIDKTEFTQSNKFNLAFRALQDIITDEIWCNDAEIGTVGEAEEFKVYNKTTDYAEAYVGISHAEDFNLIQVSIDNVNWYSYGEAGLPLRIKDRHNPSLYRIAPNDYGIVYVRTNLSSGVDSKRTARVLVYWSIVS